MTVHITLAWDEATKLRAEQRAAELGLSLDAYVASLVAKDETVKPKNAPEKAKLPISSIFGLGCSDEPTDIAKDKDKMIGEAVWQEYLRETGRS